MPTIRESRYSSIENKMITLQDISRLAEVLSNEYDSCKKNDQHSSLSFDARCSDNSSFESEDPSIFDAGSFLSNKRVLSVDMTFHRYEDNSYIDIDLYHGDYRENSITVRGHDSIWVNGITSRLSEIVDSFKPQNAFVRNHPAILITILAFGYGTIFFWIMSLIPSSSLTDRPEWVLLLRELSNRFPFLGSLFRTILIGLVGIIPTLFSMEALGELWPKIEIQVGPEHLLIEKRRRGWLYAAFVVGILPLLLQFIYDLTKGNLF